MKKIMLVMLLLLPFGAWACGMNENADGYEDASTEHVYQHWSQGAESSVPFVFLDVRTAEEYKDGHIPGAINISVQTLADHLAELPKDKRLYVYCRSGNRSTIASKLLADAGFKNVENFKGSMRAWTAAKYPIEK